MDEHYPELDQNLFIPILEIVNKAFSVHIEWRIDIQLLQDKIDELTDQYKSNDEYSLAGAIAFSIINNNVFIPYDYSQLIDLNINTFLGFLIGHEYISDYRKNFLYQPSIDIFQYEDFIKGITKQITMHPDSFHWLGIAKLYEAMYQNRKP